MAKTSVTRPKQAKNAKYMLVRYGLMGMVGFFEHREPKIPKVNTRVVVKTDRGLELGYLVGQLAGYKGGQFKLNEEQIKKYFRDSDVDFSYESAGKFVRFATSEDIGEERHLREIAKEEIECCKRFAQELELPMKIVDAEHIFGGERIIFYFMSDGRVDFRELVKKLAQEYQTRIEMRQIGSRDEAKIFGDVESCGQECCCIRFLKILKPVNMRMAKMQKATLDPSKISGYCGRLKCCLRYEDQTYTELKERLPKKNTRVKTAHGEGKVIDTQILTQLVVVEYEGGVKVALGVDEIEVIAPPMRSKRKSAEAQPPESALSYDDSDEDYQDPDEQDTALPSEQPEDREVKEQ